MAVTAKKTEIRPDSFRSRLEQAAEESKSSVRPTIRLRDLISHLLGAKKESTTTKLRP